MVTRNRPAARIALAASLVVFALALVPVALAGGGNGGGHGGGGGGSTSCTPKPPAVSVENNYAWSQWGSWGLPGQQLTYLIDVINYDVGCGSSSFTVDISAPAGFSVSPATSTVSLASGASTQIWARVTSPALVADGDYPLTVTVSRSSGSAATAIGSFVSYYKVYSSDSVAPTLFWPNPSDGSTISGKSYTMVVSASDDHAVKSIDVYVDGVFKSTTSCDDLTYTCQLDYRWAVSRGAHTATFKSTDWKGNVGELRVGFTAG
jgi:hypothetical protein